MKIKTNALVWILGLILLTSCGNDDDDDDGGGDAPLSEDFNFEGQSYSFTSGYSIDGVEPSDGIYYSEFVIGTSPFTLNEFTLPEVTIGDFQMTEAILYVNLLNEGDTFETGTYVYSETQLPKFFEAGYIRFPGIDNTFNLEDYYYFFNGGTVTVSGTPSNYSLEFNVTLYTGQNLNFTYDHNFTYLDAF